MALPSSPVCSAIHADDEESEQDEGQGAEARGPCGSRKAQRTLSEAYGYDSFAEPCSTSRHEVCCASICNLKPNV